MTSMKQENCKLNLDWGLGDIRIAVEDVMVVDLVGNAVKGVQVDMYSFPVLIEVAIMPEFKKVNL